MPAARLVWLWAPVVLYMALIYALSARPSAPLPPGIDDFTAHVLGYAGLSVLVLRALAGGMAVPLSRRTTATALLIVVGYGASDEVHQMFIPGRDASPVDLVADALGAVAGRWGWQACAIIGRFARLTRRSDV